MFSIRFSNSRGEAQEPDVAFGRIVAGDLDETFESPVHYWGEASYRSSWRDELSRILCGADKAVLWTVVVDPSKANWLRGYTLYRFDADIRVQERLFIIDEFQSKLDLDNPSQVLPSYESVNEDGVRISEWSISPEHVREFIEAEYGGAASC